jgi:hypothetical protein
MKTKAKNGSWRNLSKNEDNLMIDTLLMVDVILVSIEKGGCDGKGYSVHKSIHVESAKIKSIPQPNEVFKVVRGGALRQEYKCLRISSGLERVDHYDRVVFAEICGGDEFSGDRGGIIGFAVTYPEIVEEDHPEILSEYFENGYAEEFIYHLKAVCAVKYVVINVPFEGGDNFYHVFHILKAVIDGNGDILNYESMGFAVTSRAGHFECGLTKKEAVEKATVLIKARAEDQVASTLGMNN